MKGPFLMDCSRLNSIPGENKKRGFIWFLLFSWLASLGLLLVFLIREMLLNEETFIVRNAPAPSTGAESLEGLEGRGAGASGCRWLGVQPPPSGSSPPALSRPRFSPGSRPAITEVGFCLRWALRQGWPFWTARNAPPAWAGFPSPSRNATRALPLGLSGKLSGRWLHFCPPRNPACTSQIIWTTVPLRAVLASK